MVFQRHNINILFFLLCFLSACILFAGEKKQDSGTPLPPPEQFLPETGKTYAFQCSVSRKNTWSMNIPGVRKKAYRADDFKLNTGGLLQRKKSTSPTGIELVYEIGILNGSANGLPIDGSPLIGKKAEIRMNPGKTTVSLPDQSGRTTVQSADDQQSLLHGQTQVLPRAKVSEIPPEDLIASLFPYPEDSLQDYIPDWKVLKENEESKINLDMFTRHLRNQGFVFQDNQISGTVKRGKPVVFRGIRVIPVHLEMSSENIPGYDFQFSMTLFFSGQNAAAPLRIQRKMLEITDQVLPADNPWYSGNAIQVIRSEEINMTFLPWKDTP